MIGLVFAKEFCKRYSFLINKDTIIFYLKMVAVTKSRKEGVILRENQILHIFQHEKKYININELAKRLSVSSRTIRNDIKILQAEGPGNGFEIAQKRGLGFGIIIQDKKRFNEYLKDNNMNIYSPRERLDLIIKLLLFSKDYTTLENIAQKLNVSRSIIKKDMLRVEEVLSKFGVKIYKRAHYGQKIDLSLQDRERLILNFYDLNNRFVRNEIDINLDTEKFDVIKKALIVQLKQQRLTANDVELQSITNYLKICIYYLVKFSDNDNRNNLIDDSNQKYMRIIKNIDRVVVNLYSKPLCCEDKKNLAILLRTKTRNVNKKEFNIYENELQEILNDFLRNVDQEYNTCFYNDNEFKEHLLIHIGALIDRSYREISFVNPLVQEISLRYSSLFNICIQFSDILENKYGIRMTQDELGFIATHFAAHMEKERYSKLASFEKIAVVCSSGGGSSILLKLKLKRVFSSSVIKTFSLFELEELKRFNPDIIFTIKDLDERFEIPVIRIRELLDDHDLARIENMFSGMPEDANVCEKICRLFRKECFYIWEGDDYIKILKLMSLEIEKRGYSAKGYSRSVIEREKILSTIYGNGIAIPHPIEMCGNENIISIGIVKNSKKLKIVFMINLIKGDLELHQLISTTLFRLMSDEYYMNRLQQVRSYEDFITEFLNFQLGGKL